MGQSTPQNNTPLLEEQLRSMAEEELLDFWEETQLLDSLMCEGCGLESEENALEYERFILNELQFRYSRKSFEKNKVFFSAGGCSEGGKKQKNNVEKIENR